MKDRIKKISAIIRRIAKKDTAIGHFICFAYQFFSNPLVTSFVTAIAPLILSIVLAKSKIETYITLLVVYYGLVLAIGVAKSHLIQKRKDTAIFQKALANLSSICAAYSRDIVKVASKFQGTRPKSKEDMLNDLRFADFQTAAFYVCNKLAETLRKDVSPGEIYVTVFQRDSTSCKMIAYSDDNEPTSFNEIYHIPSPTETEGEKEYFHSVIFAKNQKHPAYLENRDEIIKNFLNHKGCEERETRIVQYIGVPIVADTNGVIFLLQLDTAVTGFFGDTKAEMEELYNNTIKPFALWLHMIYEEARFAELAICKGGTK